MSEADTGAGAPVAPDERRVNHALRGIFEEAYELIHPFFDPHNAWGGHSLEHLAFRVLREHFPQISAHEVEEIVAAAHRVYTTRHLPEGRHPFRR